MAGDDRAAAMEVRQNAREGKRTAVRATKAAMSRPGGRHLKSTGGRSRWVLTSGKLQHATKGGWSRNSTLRAASQKEQLRKAWKSTFFSCLLEKGSVISVKSKTKRTGPSN